MPARLKVYRTAIGFHDAYVAAPSQKAALAAWGTDKPLFARGAAELVTDPALTQAPLAAPGTVVKRLRGTEAEQIAALPPDRPETGSAPKPRQAAKPKRPPAPKPSRAALDAAEQALRDAEAEQAAECEDLDRRERALRDERQALERRQARAAERLERAVERAEAAYRRALADWQG